MYCLLGLTWLHRLDKGSKEWILRVAGKVDKESLQDSFNIKYTSGAEVVTMEWVVQNVSDNSHLRKGLHN